MEISRYLRQHARTIAGKSQLFMNSYAKALEVSVFGIWVLFTVAIYVCVLIFYYFSHSNSWGSRCNTCLSEVVKNLFSFALIVLSLYIYNVIAGYTSPIMWQRWIWCYWRAEQAKAETCASFWFDLPSLCILHVYLHICFTQRKWRVSEPECLAIV